MIIILPLPCQKLDWCNLIPFNINDLRHALSTTPNIHFIFSTGWQVNNGPPKSDSRND